MDLKKLDIKISFLPRAAKKKLLEKFLIMTNDNFIWLEATQKECTDEAIIEIPEQTSEACRLFIRLATRSSRF
jgi:hypothetical protein